MEEKISYTKRIKEYCQTHKNSILDVSHVSDNIFVDIPYKTLLKILNRLAQDGVIQPVSKGVYYIGKKYLPEDEILSKYVEKGKGMVIGYKLYNRIGLSPYQDSIIEAFTNSISSQHKTIGNLRLKKALLTFDDATIDLVSLLEALNAGYNIKLCNYFTYKSITDLLSKSYNDSIFEKIINAIAYPYSTIAKLNEILMRNKIDNNCIDIYSKTEKD